MGGFIIEEEGLEDHSWGRRIEGLAHGEEGRGFTIGEDNEWGIEIGEVGLGDLHLRKEDWEDL
jgi:hypothetical protein